MTAVPILVPMVGPVDQHLRWLRARGLRSTTITNRIGALRRLERSLGVELLDADATLVEAWYDRLIDQLDCDTRAAYLSHARQFYRWAMREGLAVEDPTARLDRPRAKRRIPRPIATDELAVALESARDPVRAWLHLAAYAGLRACEIAVLRREEILEHADPPIIMVSEGKGGRPRVVPLHPVVAGVVLERAPRFGFMYRHRDKAGPPSAQNVSQRANRELRLAGCDASLHQLRHWFGTETYRACSDIRVVQELMGHGSPVWTAGYAAHSPSRGVDAVAALRIA